MARILLVDDSDAVRELIRMFLLPLHDVVEASNGEEAIDLYKQERPDAVLLDITMPGMNGLQILQELRELDDDARVAMLTALHEAQTVHEALKLGALDYVVKPFTSARVIAAIERLTSALPGERADSDAFQQQR